MPPAERRALLLLLGLAVAGQGIRYLATKPGEAPGQIQLLATLSPGSARAQRDSAARLGRALAPDEKIDVDTATAADLARLPRVGLRLAKTIVADRSAHGRFGSLTGLDRVPGIGPRLLKVIAPHVVFSGSAEPPGSQSQPSAVNLNSATAEELDALPGIGPGKAAAIVQYRSEHGPFASVDELGRVPGFGPTALTRLQGFLSTR